jgi:pyruvate-ferredoxin/flavodoxin oxidoreductase
MSEVRYNSLVRTFPDRAERLFKNAENSAKDRLNSYKRLAVNLDA